MPIALAPRNRTVYVRKIGAEEKVCRRLREIGICEGSAVMLLDSSGGNVILSVKEGRLCLDKTLASKILVG